MSPLALQHVHCQPCPEPWAAGLWIPDAIRHYLPMITPHPAPELMVEGKNCSFVGVGSVVNRNPQEVGGRGGQKGPGPPGCVRQGDGGRGLCLSRYWNE